MGRTNTPEVIATLVCNVGEQFKPEHDRADFS